MRNWPWIATIIAAVTCLSPIGQSMMRNAFLSSEQLSRNIAMPFVLMAFAIFLVLGLFEWRVRRRRKHSAPEA